MRILVVDDRAMERMFLRGMLQQDGHVVEEAEKARTALDILAKERTDMVLLDVNLEDHEDQIDGIGALSLIKSRYANLPVIMVTGETSPEPHIKGMEGGADDYILKAADSRVILSRIRSIERRGKMSGPASQSGASALQFSQTELLCTAPNGRSTMLSPTQFTLLYRLNQHREGLTKKDLALALWGPSSGDSRSIATIEVYISGLRKKLRQDLRLDDVIQNIRGGYQLKIK